MKHIILLLLVTGLLANCDLWKQKHTKYIEVIYSGGNIYLLEIAEEKVDYYGNLIYDANCSQWGRYAIQR